MYSTLSSKKESENSTVVDSKISSNHDGTTNISSNHYTVDMRSDTLSTPSIEMRKVMYDAIVGDDVYGEDPTANELERKSAELFGMESALFVPSGTMANLLAIMVHCSRRGTEAIVGDLSHTFLYEQGGASHIAGVQLSTIPNKPDGTFCLNELKRKIRSPDYHEPITSLVIVENTHNMCGGKVLPLEWIERLVKICKMENSNISLHMDGARVFNAAIALNVNVDRIVKDFDSVCFCLSKGLTAPVGSVLVGSKDFINEARRLRKALGGGMRQIGILAAAGLYALNEIVPRLDDDHKKTLKIAEAINSIRSGNICVDIENVHSNILLINLMNKKITSNDFATRLACVTQKELDDGIIASSDRITISKQSTNNSKGIVLKVSARDWNFARIVLYQQITEMDTELAIKKLNYVIREFDEMLQ